MSLLFSRRALPHPETSLRATHCGDKGAKSGVQSRDPIASALEGSIDIDSSYFLDYPGVSALSILVVDDDPWILRMVSSSLVKYPRYQVDVARDGLQALERIRSSAPALVVLDIMMPRMDGWALAQAMRSDPDLASIPLLFLSALGPEPERLAALGLSERHHISKPFRFQELEERISQLIAELPEPAHNTRPNGNSPHAPEAEPAHALDGYLEQLSLSSLLVMMEMERKDGILTLHRESPAARGQVFLRAGRVVNANLDESPNIGPKDSTYEMLRWNRGRFHFQATSVELDDQVQVSTTGLLMESARITDEAARDA